MRNSYPESCPNCGSLLGRMNFHESSLANVPTYILSQTVGVMIRSRSCVCMLCGEEYIVRLDQVTRGGRGIWIRWSIISCRKILSIYSESKRDYLKWDIITSYKQADAVGVYWELFAEENRGKYSDYWDRPIT